MTMNAPPINEAAVKKAHFDCLGILTVSPVCKYGLTGHVVNYTLQLWKGLPS
jgi:hypothetical protein